MGEGPFSYPYMYWVGMNTKPSADPAAIKELSKFYSYTHLPEVVAGNPGFVRGARYELAEPDPRGDFGPRWLAMYEMSDEAAAHGYIKRNDGPPEGKPVYSEWPPARNDVETKWRMIWRQIAAAGKSSQPPHSIFMVGMNVPPGTTADELKQFNEFYTNIHVPEVMEHGSYPHATRWELLREFQHPEPGCPQFCAIYEADETATEANRKRRADPNAPRGKVTAGPPVWEGHITLWRLVYRLIDY
jgi:hypothetical protein